jgi:hypothetical protein
MPKHSLKRKYCRNNMSKKILTIINTKIDLVQDTLNTLVKKDEEPVSDETVSPSINYQTDVEAMQPAQSDISTLTPPQGSEVSGSEVSGSEVSGSEVSGSEAPSNEAIGSDATTISEEPKKGGKPRTNKRRKNNRNKSKNRRR